MTPFEDLLRELGALLGLTLREDKHGACGLQVNDHFVVQIRIDKKTDRILLAALLAEVGPGKFREEVLKEALKANGMIPPLPTLGYSSKNNHLATFDFLEKESLTPMALLERLAAFIEYSLHWQQALQHNQSAPTALKTSHPPMTGLWP